MAIRGTTLVAAACAVALVAAAPAAAAPPITARPALKPAFALGIPDYTVRCHPGRPVRFDVDPPAGTRVAVGDGSARSGHFTASVDLVPGRAVALRVLDAKRTRTYGVRCLPEDFIHWRATRNGKPQAGWYLVTPDIKKPKHYEEAAGFAIVFDSHGVPVWWMRRTPSPYGADLLPNGHLAWTDYVARNPSTAGYEEWTITGQLVHTWTTVGSETNQHDFRLLPNGNALLLTYRPRHGVDLSRWGGPKTTTVLDGEVQEVDPQGRLVWSWNTKDHIALSASGRWMHWLIKHPVGREANGKPVVDLAHVNSVEPWGNQLVISARYLDAVYGIDRTTGSVLWKLGGTHTSKSLEIAEDPFASKDFGGQHDARLVDGGRALTVYDNATRRNRRPRALAFRLDVAHRRARLVESVEFPPAGDSWCCGSARRLPGGNWVVSWGNTDWVTELTPSGRPVLTIEFTGDKPSYRAVPIMPGRWSRELLRDAMDAMAP